MSLDADRERALRTLDRLDHPTERRRRARLRLVRHLARLVRTACSDDSEKVPHLVATEHLEAFSEFIGIPAENVVEVVVGRKFLETTLHNPICLIVRTTNWYTSAKIDAYDATKHPGHCAFFLLLRIRITARSQEEARGVRGFV